MGITAHIPHSNRTCAVSAYDLILYNNSELRIYWISILHTTLLHIRIKSISFSTVSGIPLLSAANINDNSILMNEISRWITNEEWKIENQRTNIEVGDVLLTIVGSIGRSAVVQNNNHFALQRSVAVIKPCLINPLYLMHIVQSPQIQKWLTDNSKGTAQKGIYLNALSLMIIPIPPLAEQARIVEHIHIAYKHLDLISNALL